MPMDIHLPMWARRIGSVMVVASSGLLTYAGVGALRQTRPTKAVTPAVANVPKAPRVNPFASDNGLHLIAFVITASDCGWSTQPMAMSAVAGLRRRLNTAHGANFAKVSVVGVALDRDVGEGMAFLSRIASKRLAETFDQISVGGSWLNEEVVRFVWRENAAPAASPQVIVISRPIETGGYLSGKIVVAHDSLLVNLVRSTEILDWIGDATPLRRVASQREAPES